MCQVLYNRSNQVLLVENERYRLYSYKTLVYEVVMMENGQRVVTVDGTGKYSRTTSKHITQAKQFLGFI